MHIAHASKGGNTDAKIRDVGDAILTPLLCSAFPSSDNLLSLYFSPLLFSSCSRSFLLIAIHSSAPHAPRRILFESFFSCCTTKFPIHERYSSRLYKLTYFPLLFFFTSRRTRKNSYLAFPAVGLI